MQIITPFTTQLLVQACLKAGYIEHEENYPLVVELPRSFLFISRCTNDDIWLVSKFWKDGDWNYQPHAECETFTEALVKFNEVFAQAQKEFE